MNGSDVKDKALQGGNFQHESSFLKNMPSLRRTLTLLSLFSIAMGFLEAVVVIYLREIYYPDGFRFPLVPIPSRMALIEILREAATLIMLVTIGLLAGKTPARRFSYFLFCFAVWDLFYYVFLKLFLGWPESLFTFDILFLIPVPWTGPVLAPCLASLTMILLALVLVYCENKNSKVQILRSEWLLLAAGATVILASFVQDYMLYVFRNNRAVWVAGNSRELFDDFLNYIPLTFNWMLFLSGEALLLAAIAGILRRLNKELRMRDS